MLYIILFISLLTTALALVAAGAHALELPAKLKLSQTEYRTVQQLYSRSNNVGMVEGIAIVSSFLLLLLVPKSFLTLSASMIALISLVGMTLIFWFFTRPLNQESKNWTKFKTNWTDMRSEWEYSHAVRAGCALLALVALIIVAMNL